MENVLHLIIEYGYFGLYVTMTISIIGIPIPAESILTFAGYLVFQKNLYLIPTIIIASLGSFTGVTISYFLGHLLSDKLLFKLQTIFGISESNLFKTKKWLENYGSWIIMIGYYIPGVRHLTAIVAGSSQIKYSRFAFFAFVGGFFWSLTFILLGFYVGKKWMSIIAQIHNHIFFITFSFLSLIILYFIFKVSYTKKHSKKKTQDL